MDKTIAWLLEGDISVRYMTHRDLLHSNEKVLPELQNRIPLEGYGAAFLSCRSENGHWGLHYYQPKWTSTHYTLLDLKNLCVPSDTKPCRELVKKMFDDCMTSDGGLNLSKYEHPSDICVDGMILNYAACFCPDEPRLDNLVDHLISQQRLDGGFTWDRNSSKSDPHTTVCVLEGFGQYLKTVGRHRVAEIESASVKAVEFLLSNGLFMDNSDPRYRKLSYPYRYRYDLLRALEYFTAQKVSYDPRMQPALDWLCGKRRKDSLWYLENVHKGNVHFDMERAGEPSRFITLKALSILDYFSQ